MNAIRIAVILAALALLSHCAGCIGIVDFGDPGDGRPIDLPDYEEAAK